MEEQKQEKKKNLSSKERKMRKIQKYFPIPKLYEYSVAKKADQYYQTLIEEYKKEGKEPPPAIAFLSEKELMFIQEWFKDFNASRAYDVAFPPRKTEKRSHHCRSNQANLLLKSQRIRDAIKALVEMSIAHPEGIIAALAQLAQTAKRDMDKIRALELLGKWRRLWEDRRYVSTSEMPKFVFIIEKGEEKSAQDFFVQKAVVKDVDGEQEKSSDIQISLKNEE